MSISELNIPATRSTRLAVDIPGFFLAVDKALQLHIKSDNVPAGTDPKFVHEFPKQRLTKTDDEFDVITFRVKRAEMAPTDNTGVRKPRGPSLREVKPHPLLGGYNLRTFGWWELIQAEFTIWSKSNAKADDLTNWFHRFMMKYGHMHKFFLARGADKFRFVSREDDPVDLKEGQEIYKRKLVYEIRLETLDMTEEKTLEDITLGLSKSDGTENQAVIIDATGSYIRNNL